jgi:hypothetical protein
VDPALTSRIKAWSIRCSAGAGVAPALCDTAVVARKSGTTAAPNRANQRDE